VEKMTDHDLFSNIYADMKAQLDKSEDEMCLAVGLTEEEEYEFFKEKTVSQSVARKIMDFHRRHCSW
jgi:hypothetical protein